MILFALVALVSIISVNDAFADHSENIIRTVEESGFSQSCVESGCYTPVAAKVSVANLSGANLEGADLTGANISGVNFSYADLRDAEGLD